MKRRRRYTPRTFKRCPHTDAQAAKLFVPVLRELCRPALGARTKQA